MTGMTDMYNYLLGSGINCTLDPIKLQIIGIVKGHNFTIYYHPNLKHPTHKPQHNQVVLDFNGFVIFHPRDNGDLGSIMNSIQ